MKYICLLLCQCFLVFQTWGVPAFMEEELSQQEINIIQQSKRLPTPSYQVNKPEETVQVGDVLSVQIFNEKDLSQNEVVVDRNYQINMPLLGRISVRNQSLSQLENTLAQQYEKQQILVTPHVQVMRVSQRPFYIAGEVHQSGVYPYTDDLTIMHAVSIAGGFTDRAKKKRIKVLRTINGVSQELWLSPYDFVHPHDMIEIQERFF